MATLTIAQLKDELKKQNVSFEDGKLKKYYVDLYTSSKRKSAPPTTFSDDEDASATAKIASPKARRSLGRPAPTTPQKKTEADSNELDDDALRQELTSRGHTPGPITASTRDLYRKMLKDSLNAETSGTPQRNASAPNTPSKRAKSKPLLLSDDEDGTSQTDGSSRSPGRRSRSSSATRRRSEVEKLQLDNPGPRMADVVPDGTSTLPRSRRVASVTPATSEAPKSDARPKASGTCSRDCLGGTMTRQNIIMLAILVAIAISVVCALRCGISLPEAAKTIGKTAAKAAKKS